MPTLMCDLCCTRTQRDPLEQTAPRQASKSAAKGANRDWRLEPRKLKVTKWNYQTDWVAADDASGRSAKILRRPHPLMFPITIRTVQAEVRLPTPCCRCRRNRVRVSERTPSPVG